MRNEVGTNPCGEVPAQHNRCDFGGIRRGQSLEDYAVSARSTRGSEVGDEERSHQGQRLTAPRDPAEDFRGEKHLQVLGEEEDEVHPDHVEQSDDHDPSIAKAFRNELQ